MMTDESNPAFTIQKLNDRNMNASKVKDQSESLPTKILKRVYEKYLDVDNNMER